MSRRLGLALLPRRRSRWALALALLAVAPSAGAQAPKTGADYYEDKTDLGFKFKAPDSWEFIPPQPNEPNLIGKYSAPSSTGILFPKENSYWPYSAWIVRFDRRAGLDQGSVKDVGDAKVYRPPGAKDLAEWIEKDIGVRAGFQQAESAPLKIKGCDATEYVFTGANGGVDLALYAAVYKVHEQAEVALVFNGPGDPKKWSKFEGAFRKIAKTFVPLTVEASDAPATLGGGALRETKRAKLQGDVARMPGWELYETENYFVVSNNDDQEFLDELMERLEAIRKVYEEHYPPALAEELRALAAKNAEQQPSEGDGAPAQEPRTEAAEADPMERSRTSVVRVCQNEAQYHSYGGPSGSAGYWSPVDEELVIYDDKAEGGRRNTWATLNHEAFHQYCFYFFGSLSPHSWYNEGTGDFYSGYQFKNERFTLEPFDWRERLIQQLIRDTERAGSPKYVPLNELVRYTQAEYYGQNKRGVDGGDNYATGWSLIYFLRNGPKKAKLWNPAWGKILDTYLRVLVETDDLDQAVEQAFAGVDWNELEAAWKDYILKG
jgi:hypothetical protein